jgi:oligopeptide/dipeptide ABC transporter ATP-binding protein
MALLEISNLHLHISTYDGDAHILAGVNLTLERGQIRGLVGETGCGKSLTGLSVSRLVPTPPARYTAGAIRFDGRDLMALDDRAMRPLRGRRIGMIFQDPTTNLNPAFRIGEQMMDVAINAARHDPGVLGLAAGAKSREIRNAARAQAIGLLNRVGIHDAARRIDDYPHEFSGGMRQRVLIAMALMARPDILVADEPTTALDVSVQAQILKLVKELVADFGIGVFLITHNLGVVAQTCSHVSVMYAGTVVEDGPVSAVFRAPSHPYTRALLAAVPRAGIKRGELTGIAGSVPSLLSPPPGCRFAPRCRLATDACSAAPPPVRDVADGHTSACLLSGGGVR